MKVSKIKENIIDAKDVAQAMDNAGIEYLSLGCVNWVKEYPYKPEVRVRVAHTDSSLLLDYEVKEETVRAAAKGDNGNVWEDSCVEFFFKDSQAEKYYNIECNCAGTLLIAEGEGRNDRRHLPVEKLEKVSRWSSLGSAQFEERNAPESWHMSLVIPKDIICLDKEALDEKGYLANVYKCGDALKTPHFVSLYPIETPSPDFHRPEFFRELSFEK